MIKWSVIGRTKSIASVIIRTVNLPIIFILIVAVFIPNTCLAIDTDFYSKNDILFYNPDDSTSSCTASSANSSSSSNLPDKTIKLLDSQNVKSLVQKNMDRYTYASQQTGIPWQVIAAIHYREAMLDPTKSLEDGESLPSSGTKTSVDGQPISSDANEDAKNAAQHLIDMTKMVYKIDFSMKDKISAASTDDWGKAFLAYGRGFIYKRAGATYNQSPYIMNYYDENHLSMSWPNVSGEPLSGKKDDNAGTFAVISYLGGMSFGSDCTTADGIAQGDIVKTALGLAVDHPINTSDPSTATANYRTAIVNYDNSTATYPEITDCGRFVSTVMRASGVDSNYPEVSVDTMRDYMSKKPDKYQAIGSVGIDSLQPGDIITTTEGRSHIIIYTGKNGDYYTAEASFKDHVPSVRVIGSLTWMIDGQHEVWRVIK